MKTVIITLVVVMLSSAFSFAQKVKLDEKSRDFDQLHIKLEIKLNIPAGSLAGKANYKILPLTDNFRLLRLHTESTEINDIVCEGRPLNYKIDEGVLYIEMHRAFRKTDTVDLLISYTSKPSDGIYFFAPTPEFPDMPLQCWTQGQGENNRHWYPAYDVPDDKLTSELLVTVPNGLSVIGIGELESVTFSGGSSVYHWKMSRPHVNYLNSFIAGKFSSLTENFMGTKFEYFVPDEYAKNIDLFFGKTPKMVEFFSDYSVPYPYKRYAQTTVHDFEYGGMENITATTLNRRMLHDENAYPNYSAEGLVSHELAHQWFGDLLTCRTWEHIWLNEGFATFFDNLWEECENGRDSYLLAVTGSHNDAKAASDADTSYYSDSFIANKIPAELRDGRAYSRGASILHMLRIKLGDSVFKKAMRAYVSKYEYGSVVTDNFKEVMESVSGIDLTDFFNEWIYSPGYAVFNITHKYDSLNNSVRISIRQNSSHKNGPRFYHTELPVRFYSGKFITDTLLNLDRENQEFNFTFQNKPELIVYNRFSPVFCKVNVDYSQEELLYRLKYDDDITGKILALDKLSAHAETVIPELIRSFKREKFFAVKTKIIDIIKNVKNESAKNFLLESINDNDPGVRESAAVALAEFTGDEVAKALNMNLDSELNYYVRAALYYSLMELSPDGSKELARTALKEKSHMDINRRRVFESLAKRKDPAGFDFAAKYLDYNLSTGDNHLGDIAILDYTAAMYPSHPLDAAKVIEVGLGNYYFRTRSYAADLAARFKITGLKDKLAGILKNEQRKIVTGPLTKAIEKLNK